MFPSKVAVYNDNDLIGTDATTAQSNFDPDHPLYRAFARLAKLRQDHVALRRGEQRIRTYAEKPGLFAVSRIDAASGQEILLAFNTSNAPLRSEEHTSELQSLMRNSYAVYCLNKKKTTQTYTR